MVLRLWYGLTGYLRVACEGRAPERLVNLCAREGILLWDVAPHGRGIALSLPLAALRRLRPLRRRAGVRVRILERRGLPFLLRRLRPVRAAVAMLGVALAALLVLAQFVWFFEVRGTERLSPSEVLRVAAEAGLRQGAFRPAVDPDRVAHELVLRLPGLSWASVRFFGAKAIIEVAEKGLPPPPAEAVPGDLVARRAGVVERVIVLAGEAAVRPGDVVQPGDVLIRGTAPAEGVEPDAPPPAPVRARGVVLARTWYTAYAEVERVERIRARTGRSAVRLALRVGDRWLTLWGPRRPPFRVYEQRERRHALLPGPGGRGALELVRLRYDELAVHVRPLDREEAIRRAEARLRAHLLGQVRAGARIAGVHARVVQETPAVVGVRLTVECLEDIGEFRPAGDGTPSPGPGVDPAEPLPGP